MVRRIVAVWITLVMLMGLIVISNEVAPPVRAAIITVDDDGGADYTSIQTALFVANEGDTIYVYNGTYSGLVFVNLQINLIGEDKNSTIIDGAGSGTVLRISAESVNLSGFTIKNSGTELNDAGIEFGNGHNCNVFNNIIVNNRYGIRFHSSTKNHISGNIVSNNSYSGISIDSSCDNNIIAQNNISSNTHGIILDSNNGNEITENSFSSNIYDDIRIYKSSGTYLRENTMFGRGIFMDAGQVEHWHTHDIDTSNTVNGKPVYYWKNQTGGTVPYGGGQVILANCSNIKIENQEFTDVAVGIDLGCSNDNIITGNKFSENMRGIYFYASDRNNITGNTADSNVIGIELHYSEKNYILNNDLSSNSRDGLLINSSRENVIVGNNFSLNSDHGINLRSAEDNVIFHNNIFDNTIQAFDDGTENYWDYGYPYGGNYWNDYTGADQYSGPDQDESGSDDIGDTPYTEIEGTSENQDRYPLVDIWEMDHSPPEIELVSLANNSHVKPGDLIGISISDPNLWEIEYVLNGGYFFDASGSSSSSNFHFNTTYWLDDIYTIEIFSSDIFGNSGTRWFGFTLDSIPPTIDLISPNNNSMMTIDFEITFSISDDNINQTMYSKNNEAYKSFSTPYSIDIEAWPDGKYNITVYADDTAGNMNEQLFVFTKDTSSPEITLNTPDNGSSLMEPTILDFDIVDVNLNMVSYSKNQGPFTDLHAPYDLDTTGWGDNEYRITVLAIDSAGHQSERWFVFLVDTSPPSIVSTAPVDDTTGFSSGGVIIIEFSEPMDRDSVESAISIDPYAEPSYIWSNGNRTLTLYLTEPLEPETTYQISISTQAKDLTGRGLEDQYDFSFTTGKGQGDGDNGEFPVLILLFVIIVIVAVVIVVLLITKKKKKAPGEVIPAQVEAPQTFQVTCSNCSNLLSVNDIGTTMNVTCPFCSTLLTVQSQKVPIEQPQIRPEVQSPIQMQTQQPTMQIACPACNHVFMITKTGGPMRVQCPNCGAAGTMNM